MRDTPQSLTKKKRGGGGTESSSSTHDDHRSSMGPQSVPQRSASLATSHRDVERGMGGLGSPGSSSHHQRKGGSSANNLSAKDKADFNARLEERRKQRRNQRTKRRNDRRRSSLEYQTRAMMKSPYFRSMNALVIVCVFLTILTGWLVAFVYLASDMEFRNGAVKSPLQLMNKANRAAFYKKVGKNLRDEFRGVKDNIGKHMPFARKKKDKFHSDSFEDKDQNRVPPPAPEGAPLLKANPKEVIDMRVMSAELPFEDVDGGAWKQGWDVEPIEPTKEKPLRVFVLPHSHCDPGWIKTFDDYFQSQTKQILSTIIEALVKDPKRKFIWAEISYFEWWWREQDTQTQENVRKLLANKQFEFVTGGWVQPDEANTQLYAMEIQLEEGHDFIRKTFGSEYIPKYGWSIDPFGYSPTMAYLLKKHGFKAMLIQRVHYAVKKELALHKNLEFMWRQVWDHSKNGEFDIFTHVMPFYSYDVPHTCGPDPSVCCQFDFARVPKKIDFVDVCPWHKNAREINDANLQERSLLLLDQYKKKANLYRSNVVLAPLGDDFRYRSEKEAELQYVNHQKIHDYINANVDNVEISFGTLSDYFETIMRERPFSPPVLKGSFFTYSDREQDYWSGYFTSRIFDKALDRKLERTLYAASSMGATKTELQKPRRALSLFQHHDGVTGTAKDHVVEDYARRIHDSIGETQKWILDHLVEDEESKNLAKKVGLTACWKSTAPRGLAQNLCDHGSGTKIIVYNPLETDQFCGSVKVPGRGSAHAELPCEVPGILEEPLSDEYNPNQKLAGITFHPDTGMMTHPVREEWMVWKVKKGGAYLFFPGQLAEYPEMDLEIRDGGSTVITPFWNRTVVERKLPKTADGKDSGIAIDFVYTTDLKMNNNEWFARFTSPDIQNQGVFHTDLNGFNFDTHQFRSDMPIQSQVFPMPTLASIEDSNHRMTVLSEHAQGAASLEESAIDVWLDRRLKQDDERGLAQGVMDNVPTRTRLRVVLEDTPKKEGNDKEFSITPFCKQQWKELNHPLEMFGSDEDANAAAFLDSIKLHSPFKKKRIKKGKQKRYNGPDLPTPETYNIAAVYMVYKRVDYLKEAIDTLRESDYPKSFPVVISHDGHDPDIVAYVESLKKDMNIVQIFHPYSCAEHPYEFPGEDPKLNENFQGDTYGNKRESKITCCKHHFTWMVNTVFGLKETESMDGFLFLEEDYIVAPTVYETIQKGFHYIDAKGRQKEFFGVTLDPTDGYAYMKSFTSDWVERTFVTGPMAIRRDIFAKIQENAQHFCQWDDYNWDWSIVHMMSLEFLPFKILVPGQLQAAHIGLSGGMHEGSVTDPKRMAAMRELVINGRLQAYHEDVGVPHMQRLKAPSVQTKGFGGWGHPADQEHCMQLFRGEKLQYLTSPNTSDNTSI